MNIDLGRGAQWEKLAFFRTLQRKIASTRIRTHNQEILDSNPIRVFNILSSPEKSQIFLLWGRGRTLKGSCVCSKRKALFSTLFFLTFLELVLFSSG